jgi:DNA-binding YbaB/EbfC family protein
MFKELGQVASMLRQLPKMKEEMDRFKQRLSQISAEGDAGAGMVKARVNGHMEVISCRISDEAMQLNDREMLEDLVRGAINQALERVRQQVANETSKIASSLGLPAGAGLPGIG